MSGLYLSKGSTRPLGSSHGACLILTLDFRVSNILQPSCQPVGWLSLFSLSLAPAGKTALPSLIFTFALEYFTFAVPPMHASRTRQVRSCAGPLSVSGAEALRQKRS